MHLRRTSALGREQADGLGLPGSHGCGTRRISQSVFKHDYLG